MQKNYPVSHLFIPFLALFAFILSTCEKPERDNPWDVLSKLAPGSWAPQNFEVERVDMTTARLTWAYGEYNIEGFILDRRIGEGEWQFGYMVFTREDRTWTDDDIVSEHGLKYFYRLIAFAGNNESAAKDLLFDASTPLPRDTLTQVVEVTNPATGRVWMDRNLGASRAATSQTDDQAYGHLYQWGRAADGHQKRRSAITFKLSNSNTTWNGRFILAPESPYDWRTSQNDNLWQGVNGTNNPCPPGFRLPTEAEWEAELQSWISKNAAGAFSSPLKLPGAGLRSSSGGSLSNVGFFGYYWSDEVDGTFSRFLYFSSTDVVVSSIFQANGFSVRCIKDDTSD